MPNFDAATERRNALLGALRDLDGTGPTAEELASLIGATRPTVSADLTAFEMAGWVTADRGPRHHRRRFILTPRGSRVKSVPKYGPLARVEYPRAAPAELVQVPDDPIEPELPAATPEADPLDRVVSLVEEIKAARKHLIELEAELRALVGGESR